MDSAAGLQARSASWLFKGAVPFGLVATSRLRRWARTVLEFEQLLPREFLAIIGEAP